MTPDEAVQAIKWKRTVRAVYAYGDFTMTTGRAIAYSDHPQVLIEQPDGTRVWWRADLVKLEETD